MSLLAHSSSPCDLQIEQAEGWHVVIPYVGSAKVTSENKSFDTRAGQSAVILPNSRRQVSRKSGSSAIFSIDINKVNDIIRIIPNPERSKLKIEHAISLEFTRYGNMFRTFTAICNLIDTNFDDENSLAFLGVDDLIHRWIVSCLLPHGDKEYRVVEAARIDLVCDTIRSAVDRPLTLTDMERVSGLSARALQYAFKVRFGCSPMQWQRNERLLGAHRRILSMRPGESITSIALSMGFSSSSAFTALYRRQFGQSPSDTIVRNR